MCTTTNDTRTRDQRAVRPHGLEWRVEAPRGARPLEGPGSPGPEASIAIVDPIRSAVRFPCQPHALRVLRADGLRPGRRQSLSMVVTH
jgi:hypothetical protein